MSAWERYKAWVDTLSTRGRVTLMISAGISAAGVGVVIGFAYLAWTESRPVKVPNSLATELQTEHLIIHTDLAETEAKHYAIFFEGFYDLFAADYFPLNQQRPLAMLLFGDPEAYTQFCSDIGHITSPFGFYMGPERNTIVVNLRKGLGTATHELVHHFLALGGLDHHADWVKEGIPAFFEKFIGHVDADGELQVSFGYFSNWRFSITKALIDAFTLADLFETQDQSIARSFTLFLHENGKLSPFVKALHGAGRLGNPKDILERVVQKPLPVIEREWKDWVTRQPIDSEIQLVPASFIKTNADWNSWWTENQGRLSWDSSRNRYVATPKTFPNNHQPLNTLNHPARQ